MTKASKTSAVLIVDDDEEWLDLAKTALAPKYDVHTAGSGEDGIREAENVRPALIILDIMMPGSMDGFSTFCELRKNPDTQNIPVIMFSQINEIMGLSFGQENMKEFLGQEPVAFIEKPITPARLLKAVKSALSA